MFRKLLEHAHQFHGRMLGVMLTESSCLLCPLSQLWRIQGDTAGKHTRSGAKSKQYIVRTCL